MHCGLLHSAVRMISSFSLTGCLLITGLKMIKLYQAGSLSKPHNIAAVYWFIKFSTRHFQYQACRLLWRENNKLNFKPWGNRKSSSITRHIIPSTNSPQPHTLILTIWDEILMPRDYYVYTDSAVVQALSLDCSLSLTNDKLKGFDLISEKVIWESCERFCLKFKIQLLTNISLSWNIVQFLFLVLMIF